MAQRFATNRGKQRTLQWAYRRESMPTHLYVALLASNTPTPTQDTKTLGQLTEIAAGNGYAAGGMQIACGVIDFDLYGEDDAIDIGYVRIRNIRWDASGGPIPISGNPIRWAVLTDNNATIADREVLWVWEIESNLNTNDNQFLQLTGLKLQGIDKCD